MARPEAPPGPDYPAILSTAAHDLRTPLSTVYGFARTIERMGPLDDQRARFLDQILEASRDMERLLDHVALLARVGDGRFAPEREPVDADALAARAASSAGLRPGPPREPVAVLTAPVEAGDAIGVLASAARRLDPEAPEPSIAGCGDGVEITPVGGHAAPHFEPGARVRDLALAAAQGALGALDATVVVAGETVRVRFPTT